MKSFIQKSIFINLTKMGSKVKKWRLAHLESPIKYPFVNLIGVAIPLGKMQRFLFPVLKNAVLDLPSDHTSKNANY
jgi:hypothetical protein